MRTAITVSHSGVVAIKNKRVAQDLRLRQGVVPLVDVESLHACSPQMRFSGMRLVTCKVLASDFYLLSGPGFLDASLRDEFAILVPLVIYDLGWISLSRFRCAVGYRFVGLLRTNAIRAEPSRPQAPLSLVLGSRTWPFRICTQIGSGPRTPNYAFETRPRSRSRSNPNLATTHVRKLVPESSIRILNPES